MKKRKQTDQLFELQICSAEHPVALVYGGCHIPNTCPRRDEYQFDICI